MRKSFRMVAPLRSVLSTRRDLLLENLALRVQFESLLRQLDVIPAINSSTDLQEIGQYVRKLRLDDRQTAANILGGVDLDLLKKKIKTARNIQKVFLADIISSNHTTSRRWTVVPGILCGFAAYAACSRVLMPLLYGVTHWDVASFAGAVQEFRPKPVTPRRD